MTCLGTEKGLVIETNKLLLSCSLQTIKSGNPVTDKLLKNTPLMYLEFACNVAKAILKTSAEKYQIWCRSF